IDFSDAAARRALGLMVPRAIGLGASQITFVVTTALATTLGLGAVTAFTIAFTLLQIPIGVIGVPLGVVLFPSLSRGAAVGDRDAFIGLLNRALRPRAVGVSRGLHRCAEPRHATARGGDDPSGGTGGDPSGRDRRVAVQRLPAR